MTHDAHIQAWREWLVEKYSGVPTRVALDLTQMREWASLPLDDAIQEGMIALIQAAETFEPSRGLKFITHAQTCVKWAVWNYAKSHFLIKVPRDTPSHMHEANMARGILSLDAMERVAGSDDNFVWLPGKPFDTDACLRSLEVRQAVGQLPPRLRQVMELRYWRGMTLKGVGKEMKLSRERVRQLQTKAEQKLREILEPKEGDKP